MANTGDEWGNILGLEANQREEQLANTFREMASQEEGTRRDRLSALANTEYSLADAQLRPVTISRLRAFLALDPAASQRIAASYDNVMRSMPANAAMRRVTMVQAVVNEFNAEDEDRLRSLIPNVFAGAPGHRGVAQSAVTRREEVVTKKPFWAFWRKD